MRRERERKPVGTDRDRKRLCMASASELPWNVHAFSAFMKFQLLAPFPSSLHFRGTALRVGPLWPNTCERAQKKYLLPWGFLRSLYFSRHGGAFLLPRIQTTSLDVWLCAYALHFSPVTISHDTLVSENLYRRQIFGLHMHTCLWKCFACVYVCVGHPGMCMWCICVCAWMCVRVWCAWVSLCLYMHFYMCTCICIQAFRLQASGFRMGLSYMRYCNRM